MIRGNNIPISPTGVMIMERMIAHNPILVILTDVMKMGDMNEVREINVLKISGRVVIMMMTMITMMMTIVAIIKNGRRVIRNGEITMIMAAPWVANGKNSIRSQKV